MCFALPVPSLHVPFLRLLSFFFNDTATTEIYTLSLHDALPICCHLKNIWTAPLPPETELSRQMTTSTTSIDIMRESSRSEERFSRNAETDLVCRLLLEKKKNTRNANRS